MRQVLPKAWEKQMTTTAVMNRRLRSGNACQDCGAPIHANGTRCQSCYHAHRAARARRCIDCGTRIRAENRRCAPCDLAHRKAHHRRRKECPDCGTLIKSESTRCRDCSHRNREEKHQREVSYIHSEFIFFTKTMGYKPNEAITMLAKAEGRSTKAIQRALEAATSTGDQAAA